MMQLERQKKILDYLNKNRKATTKELSQLLDVSATTIRTDLNQMDKEKLITKTHGGAVYNDRSLDNIELTGRAYIFDERALENRKEKEKPPRPYLWMDRGPSGNPSSPSSGGQLLFHQRKDAPYSGGRSRHPLNLYL